MNILQYIAKFAITLVLIMVCCVVYAYNLRFASGGVVKIKGGASVNYVVEELLPRGGIFEKTALRLYLVKSVKIGNYTFNSGDRVFDVASRIKSGESDMCTITFVPGKTVYYYKNQLISSDDFLGEITINIQEGYTMPDTYTHKCQSSRNSVLLHAKGKMDEFLQGALLNIDFKTFYLKNPNEVLTMASIVEKETGVGSERGVVASVFKNRLQLGMRLQTDPTVIYQQSAGTGELGRLLTRDDLKIEGKYNTYTIKGLPPTPIASPSMEAIYAVLKPAESRFLYFVATGDGGHNFSESYEQHVKYIHGYKKALAKHLMSSVPRGTQKSL